MRSVVSVRPLSHGSDSRVREQKSLPEQNNIYINL